MFSVIFNYFISQIMQLVIILLQLGPMPKHIGFIMDGNRRFAKRLKLETFNGHRKGFEQLENVSRDYLINFGSVFGVLVNCLSVLP